MRKNRTILILGPSKLTRGGITSVIEAHRNTITWDNWNCYWVETYQDNNKAVKLYYFIKSFLIYIYKLPKAQLIHIHLSEPISAFRKSIFFTLAKIFQKKTILHFHGFSPDTTILSNKGRLYKYLFKNADQIIVLSLFWKDQVSKVIQDSSKIKILYNPCPQVDQSYIEKTNTILFAGTLNTRKGYSDLIYAFSHLAKKYPDWKVIFAGNGEIDNAKRIAYELNVSQNILFTGWISDVEKEIIFKQASIFCLPSYAEGFPMAVLEAWAYGLPVVTTPVGGLPDVVIDKINALTFNPGDVNHLESNLEELIISKDLREILSLASLQLANNKFNIQTITKELNDIYIETINLRT